MACVSDGGYFSVGSFIGWCWNRGLIYLVVEVVVVCGLVEI